MYPEFNSEGQAAPDGQGGAFSLNDDPTEDQKLPVRFFMEGRRNEAKTKEAGRLICDDVEVCEIRLPGTQDIIRNVVSDKERQRFPKAYAAFKANTDQVAAVGTPLRDWPVITSQPGAIEEANHLGIRTVEQLAAVPEGNIRRLGIGWSDLWRKAQDWLKAAQNGAPVAKLREENNELRARLTTLEGMLQKQSEEIAAARNGTLPAAPAAPDGRMAALEAQLAQLSERLTLAPSAPAATKRKYVRKTKPAEQDA